MQAPPLAAAPSLGAARPQPPLHSPPTRARTPAPTPPPRPPRPAPPPPLSLSLARAHTPAPTRQIDEAAGLIERLVASAPMSTRPAIYGMLTDHAPPALER